MSKVKKRVSFSVRIMSVILTFLLLLTTITCLGITTASAKVYYRREIAQSHLLTEGDIVNPGVTVQNLFIDLRVPEMRVYLNGNMIGNEDVVIPERAILREKTISGTAMNLLFETIDSSSLYADEFLKEELEQNEEITLSDDIIVKNTVKISDGKSHVINANGHHIYIDTGFISVFVVENRSTLTINGLGDGKEKATVFGRGALNGMEASAFRVNPNSKLILNDAVIDGGSAKNGGGVLVTGGSVEMTGCTITNCTVNQNGGGLYIDADSTANLTSCTIENNEAYDGGGIANFGTLNVKDCTVQHNSIKGGGAGIWSKGNAVITGTTVDQNTNAINGGGVTNHHNMTIKDCTISSNSATGMGGGLFIESDGSTVLEGKNVISGNTANDGAGINHRQGKLSVSDTSFLNNSAKSAGGGIWANSGTEISLVNVKMQYNNCKTNGGAINSHGTVSLKNCVINSNSADSNGGGVYMDSSSALTVVNSSITYCQSKVSGGGIYFYSGDLILAGGKIKITDCQTKGNADNINQREFKTIQIKGELSSGSEIGFKPPADGADRNITTGYGQNNSVAPARYFHCDTNDFKINKEKSDEVYLLEGLRATHSTYKVSIYIKVTDDADAWGYANFLIFARDDRGLGLRNPVHYSGDFHTSIDDEDESYTYEYDCGDNYFPSEVEVITAFGNLGVWRDFEADVTIKINGVNVCSNHIAHSVYGYERKSTTLKITGDKYPYPDPDSFEVDAPPGDIEDSGIITVSAVDQYGMLWRVYGSETTMKNISFPEEDTFQKLDNTGLKWKLTSNHKTNHWSTYNLIFKSGSNVYPEIIKPITVRFSFPLHVRVLVDGKEVFEKTGKEKDTIQIRNIESIPGYYINGYDKTGTGELVKVKNADYDLTLVNESVTLTAKLKPNDYKISYDANGTKDKDGGYSDIAGTMNRKTAYYDKPFTLQKVLYMREGYVFVGWNTQPDGKGTMFKDKDTVLNLTSQRKAEVKLYAIWKPDDSSTTASIFSYGTSLIYVGSAILILSIVISVIYYKRKKRQGSQTVNQ